MLLISKTDLISETELEALKAILRSLNPDAELVPITQGGVPLDKVLDTGKFNFERAQLAPGWLKEMRGEHVPETEEYGIGSFAYHARRPFHPHKFHDLLNQEWFGKGLLRSKGFSGSRPAHKLPVIGARQAASPITAPQVFSGKPFPKSIGQPIPKHANLLWRSGRSRLAICARSWCLSVKT